MQSVSVPFREIYPTSVIMSQLSLYKFFKRESVLPNPSGPLSRIIPASCIEAANKTVKDIVVLEPMVSTSGDGPEASTKKRGCYEQFTPEEKLQMGERAAEHGVTSTVQYFHKRCSDRAVKESSMRTWRNKYLTEIAKRKRVGEEETTMDLKQLPDKKRGRPLLLGDELDRRVKAYILDIQSKGAVVNSTIVIAVAQGIVSHYDSNMLEENGGHITLSKTWAKYLLYRMGFTKRRASLKAKLSVSNFLQRQEQFSYDAKVLIEMLEIPASLVINWNQTGIHYVPVSSWTMESAGLKRVEIAGGDDKR